MANVVVGLGSRNPVKIKATKRAFETLFSGNIRIVSKPVVTSVGEQPIGFRETLIGALERAIGALSNNVIYGVGIEAGLIEFASAKKGFLNLQICTIVDSEGLVSIGISPGFEPPPLVIDEISSGRSREMEEVIEKITGIENIGEKEGAVGFLTKYAVTREELSYLAVVMALIPRLNPELYPEERLMSAKELLSMLK